MNIQFVCACNKKYVGRTSNLWLNRINQLVPRKLPKSLMNKIRIAINNKKNNIQNDRLNSNLSRIQHLIENPNCFDNY